MHRSGRRRQPSGYRLAIPLIFIALAIAGAVAGAMFGTFIIRSLIEATTPSPPSGPPGGSVSPPVASDPPASGGTTPADPPPGGAGATTVEITIPAKTFYAVQIGALTERVAAQSLANAAAGKDLPAAIWEPVPGGDSLFRVRCAILTTRQTAQTLLAPVRAAGYSDAFVTSFSTSAMDISVTSQSATYLKGFESALQGMYALLESMAGAWDGYVTGGMSAQALAGRMAPVNAAADDVRQALAGLTPPADLRERHDVLQGLVNMADAAVVEMAAVAGGTAAKYPRAMSEYMSFVAAFSRLCATWR